VAQGILDFFREPLMVASIPETIADLDLIAQKLGGISIRRIIIYPAPGTAQEQDLQRLLDGTKKRACELIQGVLVEKTMGLPESIISAHIIRKLGNFVDEHDLGLISGEQGLVRLFPGCVRIPDVAFFAWNSLPNQELPTEPIPNIVPDLAIEILSEGNTTGEMEAKREDYFHAGVSLVWEIEGTHQMVRVYTSTNEMKELNASEIIQGGDVLPGFQLPVRDLFPSFNKR
jgi:Uma2 family endonuclease